MDKIKETKVYYFPNAVISVHIPDLTDDEYERRHKELEKAVAIMAKEIDRANAEKEKLKA